MWIQLLADRLERRVRAARCRNKAAAVGADPMPSILLDRDALVVDLELDALRFGLFAIDINTERDDHDDERANDEIERILFHGALFRLSSFKLVSGP
jgi:hypothetical protein